MLSEAMELRRERDAVKLDKNEQFVTLSRDLEEERTAKRQLQSDAERAEFKLKCMNEETQKLQLKAEKKQSELHRALSDKNACESVLKMREQMIETLQRQITQLKEDLRAKEI